MHNLSEMCFNHVFKTQTLQKYESESKLASLRKQTTLTKKQDEQVQTCIQKYMEVMKITQRVIEREKAEPDESGSQ